MWRVESGARECRRRRRRRDAPLLSSSTSRRVDVSVERVCACAGAGAGALVCVLCAVCRDASFGPSTYNLTLLDCFHGLNKVRLGPMPMPNTLYPTPRACARSRASLFRCRSRSRPLRRFVSPRLDRISHAIQLSAPPSRPLSIERNAALHIAHCFSISASNARLAPVHRIYSYSTRRCHGASLHAFTALARSYPRIRIPASAIRIPASACLFLANMLTHTDLSITPVANNVHSIRTCASLCCTRTPS